MPKRKRALIVGASSEVGTALVKELLSLECEVYGQFNHNSYSLEQFEPYANFTAVKKDLANTDQIKELIEFVCEENAQLDILVNTIGPFQYKNLKDLTPEEWRYQMHFNLDVAFYTAHFAQEHLIKAEGHIVNFAFAGAETLTARAFATPYCAAKAGIVVLTKSMAKALAPHRVRVNAISPGLIEEEPIQSEVRKKMADAIPAGRPGIPEEVASVLRWLLFLSPSYITGALIPVAGAWEYLE